MDDPRMRDAMLTPEFAAGCLTSVLPRSGVDLYGYHEVLHWMCKWTRRLTDEEKLQLAAMVVRTGLAPKWAVPTKIINAESQSRGGVPLELA